jgi:hypothetical protein
MTKKQFLKLVSNDKGDILQRLLDLLEKRKIKYCVIGGLAVNVYVEPVVSLDLDIVIVSSALEHLLYAAKKTFKIKKFAHSYNFISPKSDLRIQLQTDLRYQEFISRSSIKKVMGYKMQVASIDDVLQGKIWAYSDRQRRRSKRQKDLADIFRIIESYPKLKNKLSQSIKNRL